MNQTEGFERLEEKVFFWACNPIEWVKAFFPQLDVETTETGLSTQQEQATRELGKLIRAKLKLHRGDKMTPEEKTYSKKIGISIMSGQGTGKDFWVALMGCFFLTCFPYPKLTATANTGKQLRNVLWSEISKIMDLSKRTDPNNPNSPTILRQLLTWQAERVFLTTQRGERWFWEGVTCNARGSAEEQAEVLGGRHEDYMLLIADEATGLPDAVFKPLEGTLTGIVNLLVLIFNPTRTKGFAIRSQTDPRFIHLRWNGEESERVPKEHCRSMELKYGRDSNTYRIRILGLPPYSDENTLIPWDMIEAAKDRWEYMEPNEEDPVIKGVDVGGGGDPSVVCTRRGGKVLGFKQNNDEDTTKIAHWVVVDADRDDTDAVMIDLIGLGRGVYYIVRQLRAGRVYAIDARKKARLEDQFYNVRAQMYWDLRQAFEDGTIAIPDNENLINQLGATKTKKSETTSKIQIIGKDKIKQELEGDSPNEADALAMTYAYPESLFKKHKSKSDYEEDKQEEGGGWMAA